MVILNRLPFRDTLDMATMIEYKGKLIRINPEKATELQFSTNRGLSWHHRGNAFAGGYARPLNLRQYRTEK